MMSKLFVHIRVRALDIVLEVRLEIWGTGPKDRLICRYLTVIT
jgi:hypothetical protein